MNGNCSTTGRNSPERLPDTVQLEHQWKSIDWKKAEAEVSRLQARIAKATQEKKWNTVKRLQYLLSHSYYAKALAVRKVTTNKGKHTPGIDKELWNTPAVKMRNVLILTDKGYKAKPLRRVFIEKPGKKKKRPLGIPCMYDRAMQALYALALDPVSETTADEKSFGYPIGYVQHKNPMAKKRSVCPYTPEGRIGLHDNLRVNTKPLLELMRQPLYNGSAEYADNRLSLFSAQWGRCAVTGAEFTATSDIHCHHKKLKSNGGSDKYENLVLVLEPVHKLIHAQKPETIAHYLEVLNLNPAQLEKVNGLRKQAGILEIKSEPCKGTQNEIYNTYSLRQKG